MYTSCMKRMANNPVTPESASLAFLEAVRSWGVGENGSVNVASIAATMDIRYSMRMGMKHEISMVDSAAKHALMTVKSLEPRDIYVPGVDNDIFCNRSLLALSGAIGHAVTVDDVHALVAEVRRRTAGRNSTKRGNYSLLAEIYRTPLLGAMMTALCDCNEYVAIEVHGADAIGEPLLSSLYYDEEFKQFSEGGVNSRAAHDVSLEASLIRPNLCEWAFEEKTPQTF
ncbi:hypothetical protein HPB51_025188 [Rhipicephalus microplus]|uniref:Uncharacterized protein n=1 Tax=Rhipicephalus microplus TaxID=6941 RepID=A0A9J6EEJ8_RHIMP|nr:hypothetical protein HPB51_025188 [Rhipicephalus microplus]